MEDRRLMWTVCLVLSSLLGWTSAIQIREFNGYCLGEPAMDRKVEVIVRPASSFRCALMNEASLKRMAVGQYPAGRCQLAQVTLDDCTDEEKFSHISMTGLMKCNFSNGCSRFNGARQSLDKLKDRLGMALNEGRPSTTQKAIVRQGGLTFRFLYKRARLSTFQSMCRGGGGEKILNTDHYRCTCPEDCSCPGGKVFKQCGSACPTTCENRNQIAVCSSECVQGCFCPDGSVERGDKCIKVQECDPTDEDKTSEEESDEDKTSEEESDEDTEKPTVEESDKDEASEEESDKDETSEEETEETEDKTEKSPSNECPLGKVYRQCGNPCPPSCETPNPFCIAGCSDPGCFCPFGMLEKGDKCVRQNECADSEKSKPTQRPGPNRPKPGGTGPRPTGRPEKPKLEGTGPRPTRRPRPNRPKPEGTGSRPTGRPVTKPEGTGPRPTRRPRPDRPKPEGTGPRPTGRPEKPKPEGTGPRPTRRPRPDRPKPEGTGPRPTGRPEKPKPEGTGPRPTGRPEKPKPEGTGPRPTRRPRPDRSKTVGTDPRPTGKSEKPTPEGTGRPEKPKPEVTAPEPATCPEGMEYQFCGTACEPTCENPSPLFCTFQCVQGCFCPRGMLKSGDECVIPEQCGEKSTRQPRPGPPNRPKA